MLRDLNLIPDAPGARTWDNMRRIGAWAQEAAERLVDLATQRVTTDYTVAATDGVILADATSAPLTVFLPPAEERLGLPGIRIKRLNAGANAVTVRPNGASLVDGAATLTISTANTVYELHSDGTDYWIV